MCNAIAFGFGQEPKPRVQFDKMPRFSHSASAVALSGVMMRPFEGVNGVFTEDQVLNAIRPLIDIMYCNQQWYLLNRL